MQKVVVEGPGSFDKLKIKDFPDLKASGKEVLIKVKAIGVNFADVCVRLGVYSSAKKYVGWPITPGFEVSGEVINVGTNCKNFKKGQKVLAFTRFNAYATQVCVPEDQVMTIPEGFSVNEASGFAAVFFTAFHALHHHVFLPISSRVLIHSAAGGVGSALIQLCKAKGFYTVGVIGSSHKRKYLERFSPDEIIDKSTQDLWKKAKEHSPKGYNAIFDANGYKTVSESYKHLCPTGKLIVYGAHDFISEKGNLNYFKAALGLFKTPKFNPMDFITSNKGVVGFNISYLLDEKELIKECINGLNTLLSEGKIKPIPVTEIDFENVGEAHRLIQSRQTTGKLVLTVKH
jgi:NADPH:quinone reductase-like Zn-dependent oxidoreductase